MKTRVFSLTDQRTERGFAFAGFQFPKYVWTLPRGAILKRAVDRRTACTGDYYHAPAPNMKTVDAGCGFYLSCKDGQPFNLRWLWCDEVADACIRHTGWFTDEYEQDETIRGIVFRLPRARGFLAGWSMGEHMASTVEYYVYADEVSAAYAADSMAENAAEEEREYRARENEEEGQ